MDRFDENPLAGRAFGDAEGLLGGDDALGRSLERWAAETRVDEAVRTRVRAHWLRVQAEEEASFVGTLVDLAERGRPVGLDVGDHRLRGVLRGIGGDFVAMRTEQGQQVLARMEAIDAVRSEPGGIDVRGDRSPLLDLELAGVLGPVAADRPLVLVRTTSEVIVRGELRSSGSDVVRIRVDGDPPTPAWVPIDKIAVLVIDP